MKFLFYQLGHTLIKAHKNERAHLFSEKRLVFFSDERIDDETDPEYYEEKPPDDSKGKKGKKEAKEAKEKKEETPQGGGAEEVTEVDRIASRINEKAQSVLDTWEYEFPADIDPEKVKNAKIAINEYYPDLQKLEEDVDNSVNELLGEMEAVGNNEAQDDLWKGVYKAVPEFTQKQLRENKQFDTSVMGSNVSTEIKQNIIAVWKKYSENPPSVRVINTYSQKLTETVKKIAENEFNMLQVIDQVREVMWDMHNKLQKKSIEERMVRSVSRRVGIPLKEGQELQGFKRTIKRSFEANKPFEDQIPARWYIKEVYVDKKRNRDPEDPNSKDEMIMNGVWVALEERGSGRIYRMSSNRLRDFINIHDIKPAVNKKEKIKENVIHLSEMGMTVKAGDTLEYDEMKIDPKTRQPFADVQKVKVLSIDDYGVKLDKKVLYRAFYDSPDEEFHDYKDYLTLAEFAKWMNMFRPLPVMKLDTLKNKLHDHYDYMNTKYKRAKNCHVPINLEPGEILFADAPGNPLFEIGSIDEAKGLIKLKNNRLFTYPQFLRWVFENDIEPFDPELEALKMKTYFKAGNRSANKAKENAASTIEHFKNTGIWRNTFKDLMKKGIKGIVGPKVELKEDEEIDVERHSYSRLKQFLNDTTWLRLDDIFQLFKSGWEYYVRNWQRRQKSRYSAVGKNIPWFGTEFERINQQAETEEVNQFKEAMDQWGVPQIEETLYDTNNQDQAKACLIVLAEKGMIRWDDKRLYVALNKFTDINHKLPIPAGDPYKKFGKNAGDFNGVPLEGKSVMDFLQDAMDSLWGEGSYVGWKRQSDGAIETAIQQSYNKAEELENDPKNVGGIAIELSNMLTRHMNGEWVDPTEYEGLLRFIIEAGKAGGRHKIYFLLMGVNARNSDGRTILGWERIGRFVSKYSNQFPALDYFSSSNVDAKRDFVTGEILVNADGNPRPYTRSDFNAVTQKWVNDGENKGYFIPGDDAEAFLRNQVLTTDAVQNRLEKGIRNAQNMDHDDTPYYIPALKESEIESVCASSGGSTKKFTIQGYKNGYIGFGMRMDALVDKYEQEKGYEITGGVGFSESYMQKLITAFKSYVRYDGILDNRYRISKRAGLQRLSSSDYQTGCVWAPNTPLKKYQDEMKNLIIEIANAYGRGDDPNIVKLPFERGVKDEVIEKFGPRFEKMIRETDGGAKLIEIVKNHTFLSANKERPDPETMFRNKARMYEYDPETIADELGEE